MPNPAPATLLTDSIVYPQGAGYAAHSDDALPADCLCLGDNLAVMAALLPEYEGRIPLIYADPPFFTNRHYPARVGRGEDSRKPRQWQLAEGYADHWTGVDAYLDFLYPRLALMYRLLAPTGTLYLHLDWHANAYARVLLDEIFGPERLLNEIVWCYHGPSPIRSAFNRKHDTILVYTKSSTYTFNVDAVRVPYDENTVKTFASSPKAGFGKVPDLERGKVPEDWWYFPVVARLHSERTGYPTQKPEALLERIIRASSNPDDLVADFFCGSGTTLVTAARLGRHFLGCDATFRAIHTSKVRLTQAAAQPFRIVMARGDHPPPARPMPPSAVHLLPQRVSLDLSLLPSLDSWEVDPAWDGKVFHSVAQAVRPRKDTPIAAALPLPPHRDGLPLCIRLVDVAGSQAEVVLPPDPSQPKQFSTVS